MVGEAQQPPCMPANVTAHLQCRAFTPGAAAHKMSENGGAEDGRQQKHLQGLAILHSINNIVGALAFCTGDFVDPHDQKTRHRQGSQEPRILRAQRRRPCNGMVEKRPDTAAQDAHHRRQDQPFAEQQCAGANTQPALPQTLLHCHIPPSPDHRLSIALSLRTMVS